MDKRILLDNIKNTDIQELVCALLDSEDDEIIELCYSLALNIYMDDEVGLKEIALTCIENPFCHKFNFVGSHFEIDMNLN